ncbi:CsbD family protein [Aquisediminimonas profunda]|uniref:CsbD family protein n=1 Tax=Aquisediminimonas profunda TaxID=1550733 RepID=UPI001C62B36F|nr:CsbD family protein [Aquisediminimonas profunda]
MGEFVDKMKGSANDVIGRSKFSAGKSTDNPTLMAKGLVQEVKGKAQKALGKVKGKTGDRI